MVYITIIQRFNPFTTESHLILCAECPSIQHIKTGFSGERVKGYFCLMFLLFSLEKLYQAKSSNRNKRTLGEDQSCCLEIRNITA